MTRSALAHAQGFLMSLLATSPVPARQVEAQARKTGISAGTLRRASVALKVKRTKEPTYQGGWVWELPQQPTTEEVPQVRTLFLCCLICGFYKDLPQLTPGAITQVCHECIMKRRRDAVLKAVKFQQEERQEEDRCRTIEKDARITARMTPTDMLPRAVDIR